MAHRLTKLTDSDSALDENEKVASRRFRLLLYAQYVCLRVFLESATAKDGIMANHKGSWLLIQVAPETLLDGDDIFYQFTVLAGGASYNYLERAILDESKTITRLLHSKPTLFCMLDEVQVLTKNLDYFRSHTDETKQPILCPIILEWQSKLPNLIVSGTGLSMRKVDIVNRSVVAKEGGCSNLVTEIGAFDDQDARRAYLKQYFLLGFLDTSLGKQIESQAGYWLRGWFVFNAAVRQVTSVC